MSIIGSMNIARTGLEVSQMGLMVVSNNVANMNTPGYLKQTMNQAELYGYTPYTSLQGTKIYTGGGVRIADITQNTNQQLLNYLNGQTSALDSLNEQLKGLEELAGIMNELGDGSLSKAMDAFYAASQSLTTDPSDAVLRLNYVNAASNVAQTFNTLSSALDAQREALVGNPAYPGSVKSSQAGIITDSINAKLQQLADINSNILNTTSSGSMSNDLINQQNAVLNELSSLIDYTTTTNSNGTINVKIAGVDVITGATQQAKLVINAGDDVNPAKISIVATDAEGKTKIDDISDLISGGQLHGVLSFASKDAQGVSIYSVSTSLDLLAKTFAESVNSVQLYNDGKMGAMSIGLDADGNKILVPSTEPIFKIPANGEAFDASNITINQTVFDNPNLVAAARVEIDADGNPIDERAIGNANNVNEILALQKKNFAELGGITFGSYLNSLVARVGLAVTNAQTKSDAQADVVDKITSNYNSVGTVSLDEELIDMVKYQRAYEASSRVFSACSEMLQVLMTLGE